MDILNSRIKAQARPKVILLEFQFSQLHKLHHLSNQYLRLQKKKRKESGVLDLKKKHDRKKKNKRRI
jgi:hypothetical protein